MRRLVLFSILTVIVSMVYSQNIEYKYFIKRKSLNDDYFLELKPATAKDSIAKATYGERIDDRDIFIGYSYSQRIEILHEILTFQGDTTKSDKLYKIKLPDLSRVEVKPFTIQIEALYTFSRMLLLAFPEMKPKLTNKKEKANYNGNQCVVDEVYAIYRKWLQDAVESDFRDLNLPMSGTKYQWEGQQKITDKWFIKFHKNDND